MATSNNTTKNTVPALGQYYDKRFLERAVSVMRYHLFGQKKSVPTNMGTNVIFTRFSALNTVGFISTEDASAVTGQTLSATNVTAEVKLMGDYVSTTELFNVTSLDKDGEEIASILGDACGLSVDETIGKELRSGATAQLATGVAALSALTGSGKEMNSTEIRKASRTLKRNKARFISGNLTKGKFAGFVPTDVVYDLQNDADWKSLNTYVNTTNIEFGRIGSLHGIDVYETNNQDFLRETTGGVLATTGAVFNSFFLGENAYGIIELDGNAGAVSQQATEGPSSGQTGSIKQTKFMIESDLVPTTHDPLAVTKVIAWKIYWATKVLNPNWIINVKTLATS